MADKNRKYNAQLVALAEKWISEHGLIHYDGARVKDLLDVLGIDARTYYKYKKQYPKFKEAIDRGCQAYLQSKVQKLEQSLLHAAEGGFVEEETESTEYVPDRRNDGDNDNANPAPTIRKMIRTKTKKYIKPDVAAAIFVITNLDPEHYQNRQRADVSIKAQTTQTEMTIEEINAELERLEKLDK